MIPFVIIMLVLLLGVYYLTIFAHFFGASVFGKVEVNIGLALIPFFYWFVKEKKVVKKPVEKEPVAKKAPVKKKKPVKKTEKK